MSEGHPSEIAIGRQTDESLPASDESGSQRVRPKLIAAVGASGAEVTDRVCAALAANPYRIGRDTDRGEVERIVRRDFVDVEPWPFGALLDA